MFATALLRRPRVPPFPSGGKKSAGQITAPFATSVSASASPAAVAAGSPVAKRKLLGSKKRPLRVCVIQSTYEGTDSPTANYDNFVCGPQLFIKQPNFTFETREISKADSYRTIRELVASQKYDVFFNLCDGGRDEKRAGVDVLNALEEFNAAFTGTDCRSFEPNKIDMKILVANAGVATPNFVMLHDVKQLQKKCCHLKFPVIVKHMSGYASVGIHKDSRCDDMEQLEKRVASFIKEFDHALVEEFIRGREGTVLVCNDPDSPQGVKVFPPMMFTFLKDADDFAHFENKWTGTWEGLTAAWLDPKDPAHPDVIDMARNSFVHVMNGVGYGRCDFRIDPSGKAYFLEINPNCGMWYPVALTGGDFADRMVMQDKDWNHLKFAEKACEFAIAQKAARTPWYVISHDSHGMFTTRASRNVEAGTELFGDLAHRIPVFVKAVYKVGDNVQRHMSNDVGCVIRRADGIQQMVAIRHSCEPNMTLIHGQTLTCAAKRQISAGEELTIDYSTLRDSSMPHFPCKCGTANCRSIIVSQPPMPRMVDVKLLRKLLRERKRAAAAAKRSAFEAKRAAVAADVQPIPPLAPTAAATTMAPSAGDVALGTLPSNAPSRVSEKPIHVDEASSNTSTPSDANSTTQTAATTAATTPNKLTAAAADATALKRRKFRR